MDGLVAPPLSGSSCGRGSAGLEFTRIFLVTFRIAGDPFVPRQVVVRCVISVFAFESCDGGVFTEHHIIFQQTTSRTAAGALYSL